MRNKIVTRLVYRKCSKKTKERGCHSAIATEYNESRAVFGKRQTFRDPIA